MIDNHTIVSEIKAWRHRLIERWGQEHNFDRDIEVDFTGNDGTAGINLCFADKVSLIDACIEQG